MKVSNLLYHTENWNYLGWMYIAQQMVLVSYIFHNFLDNKHFQKQDIQLDLDAYRCSAMLCYIHNFHDSYTSASMG